MAKVKNKYIWSDNLIHAPIIENHSRIKHSIIRDYIRSYLKVVANPNTSNIKLAIVDGFCGGGLYKTDGGDPHFGSPIIILKVIQETVAEIIGERVTNNIKRPLTVDCNVYFIDKDLQAISVLQKISASSLMLDQSLPLQIKAEFIHAEFSDVYKSLLAKIGKTKAIFILDPCGYSETPLPVIQEIMNVSGSKREIIWTFMVDAMSTFANENSQGLINAGYEGLLNLFKKDDEPTGFCVQREIFNTVKEKIGVPFFTPFAIKQNVGWNYWLIHLAWHYRASEVMKDVEHRHADQREHYGGAGLNMMASAGESSYLFSKEDEERGRTQLREQIPQLLSCSDFTQGISFSKFMEVTYNETPLRSAIIKNTLIEHEDIEIYTPMGGNRSSAIRINTADVIQLKKQTRFFFD